MSQKIQQKRKRTELALTDKIEILNLLRSNVKRTEIMNQFNIGKSTVSDIKKNEEILRQQYSDIGIKESKIAIRNRDGAIPALDGALYEWFCAARAKHIPITEDILKIKARQMTDETVQSLACPLTESIENFITKLQQFKFSNGWIVGFKKRYLIKSFKIVGHSGETDLNVVDDCRRRLQTKLMQYSPENIYNCDETALYWKCLPDHTLNLESEYVEGTKRAKDRITILLCCNSTGMDLRKPLVIGKYAKPRCFKNINIRSLGIEYKNNKTAWMTGNIFSSWLLDFDKSMRGKKVALVLDGASSHFNIQLENVNLFFLNPNTTTHCQPLDQGIIQQIKQRYRKKLLFHQVSCFDKKIEFKISLKKAVEWLVLSWRSIEKGSISKCFAKAKVIDAQIPEQSFESKIDDEFVHYNGILNKSKNVQISINVVQKKINQSIFNDLPMYYLILVEFKAIIKKIMK